MSDPLSVDELGREVARVLGDFRAVAAAWVFGSTVRSQARPDSDVDVGLIFRHRGESALDHHRELRTMAARLEPVAPGRRIDLVVLDRQGPVFCHRVLREGRLVLDADPERRIDFESTTTSRYLDFRPTWELAARHAVRGLRDWLEARR